MPQPRVSLGFGLLKLLMTFLPGLALLLATVTVLVALVQSVLTNQQILFQLLQVGLVLALAWWVYLKLPRFVRRILSSLFRRGERSHHEH